MLKHWQAIFILLLLHLSMNLYADTGFKVFQTHQPAHDLLPMIEPLYRNQAKLTARNNSLIVKAPEPVIQEISELLKQLDKPLQNLLIEVSSALDGNENLQQNSIEGRIKPGSDVVIRGSAPDTGNPNTTIRYKKDGSVVKTTHTRRSSSRSSPDNYRIRAVEGTWAHIQIGQRVPYYNTEGTYGIKNRYWRNSVEFEDVTSGFEVLPTLNGNHVTLKVRPHNRSMNRQYPDRINTRSVDTVVTGKLGQWIYLGGAINQLNENSSGYTHSTRRSTELDTSYRIRVNTID